MQKETLKSIRSWLVKNKVLDVILFGSSAREKAKPDDIDLCIIIKPDDENKSLDLTDSLGRLADKAGVKSHISILTSDLFVVGNTLVKTLLSEGFSIKKSKPLSSVIGFESKSLFAYSLKHFSPSKRVQFHYLLKGRYGSEGVLKEVRGEFIGTGSILVPTAKEDLLKEIFDRWDVRYRIRRILIS